jgi:transposase
MAKTIRLRTLTDAERTTLERLAHSRTAEARQVERARILWEARQGATAPVLAAKLGLHHVTVRERIKRFNTDGLASLVDKPRSGRPSTYGSDERSIVVATALTDPQTLGQAFGSWTLDRLERYLNDVKQIPIKRSRIDDILLAEGLRWRKQETWFGHRVDPDFVEKRGGSTSSTPPHPKAAS